MNDNVNHAENDDDDRHFCLKCKATIIGLENYVAHRKRGCNTNPDAAVDGVNLKADDFFLSLELQSSVKKAAETGGKVGPQPGPSKLTGILTRSKTLAIFESPKCAKPQQSLKLDLANINDESEADTEDELNDYESDEDDDDDYDHDHFRPPRHHTGGKWKPVSPVPWTHSQAPSTSGGKWKPKDWPPPPSYTKGKWKPMSPTSISANVPPPSYTGGKWKSKKESEDASFGSGKTRSNIPSPTCTKGKWKPANIDDLDNIPSPSCTKGKWKPLEDVAGSSEKSPLLLKDYTVKYWCKVCNRYLTSKLVYERHLQSDLHRKRAVEDFDDNNKAATVTAATSGTATSASTTQVAGTTKPPSRQEKVRTAKNPHVDYAKLDEDPERTLRKKRVLKCPVCKSKINTQQMGKHLISHYHCRRGDITSPEAHRMVLEHIHDIVMLSPFQCGTCDFYCNTELNFLGHWKSVMHSDNAKQRTGLYHCSFCDEFTASNEAMYEHLVSAEHQDVVYSINRSVPIRINNIRPFYCDQCDERFLFRVQLLRHYNSTGHRSIQSSSTANIDKQLRCAVCNVSMRSIKYYQRHLSSKHGRRLYFCGPCGKQFDSPADIQSHRASMDHQNKRKRKFVQRQCKVCGKLFSEVAQLRAHIKHLHTDALGYECTRCGERFAIVQDLAVHSRTALCKPPPTASTSTVSSFASQHNPVKKRHPCKRCTYTTDSQVELVYHEVLHEPIVGSHTGESSRVIKEYRCPLCERIFDKYAMRAHLNTHFEQRPYACALCPAAYVRQSGLSQHVRLKHTAHGGTASRAEEDKGATEGTKGNNAPTGSTGASDAGEMFSGSNEFNHLCSVCGACFKKRFLQYFEASSSFTFF